MRATFLSLAIVVVLTAQSLSAASVYDYELTTIRDVSDRKAAEEEKRKTLEDLASITRECIWAISKARS